MYIHYLSINEISNEGQSELPHICWLGGFDQVLDGQPDGLHSMLYSYIHTVQIQHLSLSICNIT